MWSEQSRTVATEHATVYYETYGDGPALLLVPGIAEVTLHYYANIPYFVRAGYKVMVMNLRGHFLSPATDEFCHPRYFPGDITAICENEGVERLALICESAGGWGGMRVAVENPDLVSALILMGSAAGIFSDENYAACLNAAKPVKDAIAAGAKRPLDLFAKNAERAFLQRQIGLLSSDDGGVIPCPAVYLDSMMDRSAWLTADDMAGYSVPTLIMGGDADDFMGRGFQRHTATLIPGAQLSSYLDAGHEPYWDNPERFNTVAHAWLKEQNWG
ncbi:MAG: alpha/beta hydrolase [Pseudomonadota bacterium]